MLDAMRRKATSWVVKAFLVLLIVSFAIWGIGDVLRAPSGSDAVARVGGEPIAASEVLRDTERTFRRLREQVGEAIERSPAVMENLLQQALAQAVARRLVDRHARDLGLAVDPATLARIVREDPLFQGPDGFDRQRFEWFLRELGTNEARYLAELEADILRARLVGAASGAIAVPESLVRELARYREERRRGRALVVLAALQQPPQPEEAELSAWLERNAARFRVPELRTVELVVLGVDELVPESMPDEATLRAAYAEREAAYTEPETRTATQLLAADRETIEEAARLLAEGKSPQEIVAALEGRGLTLSTIGPVARGLLPEALDEALFALAPGAVSPPVQSLLGWHLLRLDGVTPRTVRPFEEVREQLALELARRAAADRLPQVADQLDDALAAGESLAQAARSVGARHVVLDAVDAAGRDAEGRPIAAIELSAEMLQEIAATPEGRTSLLVHGKDDRYFAVRVTKVTPARDRGLQEVRAQVEQAWKLERQRELARERARVLLERARVGEPLESLAVGEPGLSFVPIGPLRRRGDEEPLGPFVTAALFATPAGQLAEEPVPTADGFALVACDAVLPAPEDLDVADVRREWREVLGEALLRGYEQALRRRYTVEIDQRVLAELIDDFGR